MTGSGARNSFGWMKENKVALISHRLAEKARKSKKVSVNPRPSASFGIMFQP